MNIATTRRRKSKGAWMRVRDTDLLVRYMTNADFSQARLARYCGCSRQFIHLLVTGQRTTCTKQIGELIEEALSVLPGTLFVPHKSPNSGPNGRKRRTIAA
ncbi:helix-turn-helix domain-containing protein [Tsukamurella ocularis]